MSYYKDELINKLKKLDDEVYEILGNDKPYTIIIAGGSALIINDYITRSTRDIDSIQASKELHPFFIKYDIDTNISAYALNFPESYMDRIAKIDIDSKSVNFYTLAIEDIVVAKLSSIRERDVEDVMRDKIYKDIDWELLDRLVEETKYGMLNEKDEKILSSNYALFKEGKK